MVIVFGLISFDFGQRIPHPMQDLLHIYLIDNQWNENQDLSQFGQDIRLTSLKWKS